MKDTGQACLLAFGIWISLCIWLLIFLEAETSISLAKLMIFFCWFLSCSISGNIHCIENSWPVSLLAIVICSAQTSATHTDSIYGRVEVYLASSFQLLCHLFKSVFSIFLYTDSHSNTAISYTVTSTVSITKLKVVKEIITAHCSIFKAELWKESIKADILWVLYIICWISEPYRYSFKAPLNSPSFSAPYTM